MVSKIKNISPLNETQKIDYKNVTLLASFMTGQGKILPRRATGVTAQQQKKIAKAIKQARILSLLSFINSNSI